VYARAQASVAARAALPAGTRSLWDRTGSFGPGTSPPTPTWRPSAWHLTSGAWWSRPTASGMWCRLPP